MSENWTGQSLSLSPMIPMLGPYLEFDTITDWKLFDALSCPWRFVATRRNGHFRFRPFGIRFQIVHYRTDVSYLKQILKNTWKRTGAKFYQICVVSKIKLRKYVNVMNSLNPSLSDIWTFVISDIRHHCVWKPSLFETKVSEIWTESNPNCFGVSEIHTCLDFRQTV